MDSDNVDIMVLDDMQLRRLLIARGYQPGPIVDSTREFYRKLLIHGLIMPHEVEQSTAMEEEAEDDLIQPPRVEKQRSPVRSTPVVPRGTDSTDFRRRPTEPSRSPGGTATKLRTVSEKRSQQKTSSTSLSSIMCLVILVLICVFIALVFFNVEPNPKSYQEIKGA